MQEESLAVGGQAVIEGVMMRGPNGIAIAVRRPDGEIVLKNDSFQPITKRIKWLNIPILRGAILLIETMYVGMKALTFSSDIAMEAEKQKNGAADKPRNKRRDKIETALTVVFALALGIAFFFYLPLLLTGLFGFDSGFWFNLVDGLIRMVFFLAYLYLISRWKEIRRVFEYHGAEHKSIFAYENQKELVVDSARPFTTLHPRCGTSFLLIVMVVSILVFMFLGKPETVAERLVRLAFVPLIGGLSYELIKLSAKAYRYRFFRLFLLPGLWLQRITTVEPDDQQLEVAMVALKCALGQDPAVGPSKVVLVS
ncbi:MAG TPA: DUF1385 domain-containing protein [bacterium]|nr:DUF1385 domain-containing protein [bacterium]HPN34994.1 DUF1385 domain-containing protein [bacterium]